MNFGDDLASLFAPIALGMQSAGAVFGAGAAASKSRLDKAAYETQADTMDANAELDRFAAGDAIRRGQAMQVRSQLRTSEMKGGQIAAMAANGININSDSALNILTSTDLIGINDTDVIAMNAAKEAWGYNVRAMNEEKNSDLLRKRADMEHPAKAGLTSLLTSAGAIASKWFSTRRSPLVE